MLNTSKKILEALDLQERMKPTADTVVIRHLILTGKDIRSSINKHWVRFGKRSYETHAKLSLSRTLLGKKGMDVLVEEANAYFAKTPKLYNELHKGSCPKCNDGYGNCIYPYEGLLSESGCTFNDVRADGESNAVINNRLPLGFNLSQLVPATKMTPLDLRGTYHFCRFCGRSSNYDNNPVMYHQLFKTVRPAVHPRTVYSVRDSMNESTLTVTCTDDNDVIIGVASKGRTSRTAHLEVTNSAQFCTLRGGGKSSRVRAALVELARAIIEDEAEDSTE